MKIGNKIRKRLVEINAFLKSEKKPNLKTIHNFRLEVKCLKAFLELLTVQNNFGVRQEIPNRLEKIYLEAGKIRKFGLELKDIHLITANNKFSKSGSFLHRLEFAKNKNIRKLRRIRRACQVLKLSDFAKLPDIKISYQEVQRFLASSAASVLDLLKLDINSDIRSLHQLRKILKSILYVLPLGKNRANPVDALFWKTRKGSIKSIETKIGSLHDSNFFVNWLEKKSTTRLPGERGDLRKIKQEFQNDIIRMKEDLRLLLPVIRQFALDLKDKSTR